MKLNLIAVLSLSLLLVHIHFSLARKKIRIKEKIDLFKKKILDTKTKLKQPKHNNQGSYSQQGRGGYPKQGGYHQYPAYPAQGPPYGGGYAGYGGYPGGYLNHNPNNKVLSPHYGGSFGYGGYGVGRGSPYSQSVQAMGMYPSEESRGFGRSAAMSAAGGAMAGMALGYGLGRFPRPHFNFHSPQEEYYYNHYMYRKYGVKSTDTNDYSRDYKFTQPPLSYDSYMDSCMRRDDLLPGQNRKSNKPDVAPTNITPTNTTTTAAPDAGTRNNTTKMNSTAAKNSSTSEPSTLHPVDESEASQVPPALQTPTKAATEDDDDDTVSIVEIGYPALIRGLKVRRCVELYMAYSDYYLKRQTETAETGGAQSPVSGRRGLVAVATSAALMLLNSNLLILLH